MNRERPASWFGAAVAFAMMSAGALSSPAQDQQLIRIAFSVRNIGEAHRNDLTAALKVWVETIAKERRLAIDSRAQVFDKFGDMESALRRGEVDVINVPSDEFILLEKVVPLAGLFGTTVGGSLTEEYVVLVRQDRPVQSLADLRNDRLAVLDHPRSSLALIWLETELLRRKLPSCAGFFRVITPNGSVNRTILPVFFKHMDACLVTRRAFETASELNPQLSRTLRVLASSPGLIPTVGSYRADIVVSAMEQYREAALNLDRTPSGKHILTMFQCDAVVEVSDSQFAATRAVLAEYGRLRTEAEKVPGPR